MSRTIPTYTVEGLQRRLIEMERAIFDLKRVGSWNSDNEYEIAGGSSFTRNQPQLLCMVAASASYATGGYIQFSSIAAQHGFGGVASASESWTHPVAGVYMLTYEHAWDTYAGGGTIRLELDGVETMANTVAAGTTGTLGRGTIAYFAAAGQVGKIKVAHTAGSAQAGTGTVWVALPDPVASASAATLQLYADGVLVSSSVEAFEPVNYSSATVFLGELNGTVPAVSDFYFDAATLTVAAVDALSNGGFESAIAGTGTDRSVTTGNWRAYQLGTASVARSTVTTAAGANSGRVDINSTGASQGGFFFQDVTITEGSSFEFEVQVYPTGGTQYASVLFDWDRSGASAHAASITMSGSSLTATVFGVTVSGAGLTLNQWNTVRVVVAAQELI